MKKFLLSLLTVVCLGFAANATDVTFSFGSGYGATNGSEVSEVKSDVITLTFGKGSYSTLPKYYTAGHVRFYSGNTITVKAISGYNITKIELVVASGYSFTGSVTGNKGSLSSGTWTGNESEITLTNTATAQSRFTAVNVTYEAAGGPAEPVDPKVEFEDFTLEMGASAVKAGTWPDDLNVKFTANPEGIVSIADGMISPVAVGSTTITASWEAVAEKYNAGSKDFMVNVVVETPGDVYTLVEDASNIVAGGTYLLVGINATAGTYYAMAGVYSTGKYREVTQVEVDGKSIKIAPGTVVSPITLESYGSTKFFIKTPEGYLGYQGTGNELYTYDDSENANVKGFSISLKTGNNANISFDAGSNVTRYLKYNATSPRIAGYKSGQSEVQLYKLEDGSEPTPGKQPHGLAFEKSAMDVEVDYMGAGVTLSNPNGLNVVYSSSNTTVADVDPTDGSLLAYAPGTTTITAKTEGNEEFNGGSVSYTLTVVAKPTTYNWLFDVVKNAKDGDKIVAIGNFEVIYQYGANTIVTDGKSNILIYDYNTTPAVGTKISKIEATVTIYSQLFELTGATLTEGGEGAEYTTRELTTFEGVNYDDQLFDQVVVKGATISGVSGKEGTLNLGSESIAMWNNFNIDGYANTAAGETVTVTGFVWRNNSTLQIDPISIVKEESGKVDAQLAWSAAEYTVVEYTEVSDGLPVLTNPLGIEVVYESSDEEVVMYKEGLLMAFAPGTAVITATPADTEKYYGSASFTVTVTAKPHLGAILVNGQEVKDDQTIDVVLNSEITFSAENAEMIEYKIEGDEGTVADEIVEDSSCTFTAPAALGEYMVTLSATGCGEGAEVVFMLNVVEKPAITEETLNFLENSYGMKTGSQNADNTELTGTVFTYTVNSRTGYYSDGLRMYKPNGGVDATIKATAPMGYVVAEIEPRTATDLAVTAAGFATSYGHGAGVVTFTGSTTYKLPKLYVKVEKVDAPDAESYSPDHSSFVASPNANGSITIEITHADKHAAIYYKHTAADQPAQARRRVASHEGYEVAKATVVDEKSVHSFTVPSAGNVEYYAYHTATDTKGEVKTITVDANGGVTSIVELTADLDAAAPAYDLQGRRVATPTRGLYIQNGRKLFLR